MTEDSKLDYRIARQHLQEFNNVSIPALPRWVDERYLNHEPFAFSAYDFPQMKRAICNELEVDYHNVWCTGSGALGFSLNPQKITDNTPKYFDNDSDLDIAIVDTHVFDQAWQELRESTQRHLFDSDDARNPIRDINYHKKKLFDGAIIANRLFGSIESGRKWQRAVSNLSIIASKMFHRNIQASFWIYRDIWSVRNYVANSARRMKGNL